MPTNNGGPAFPQQGTFLCPDALGNEQLLYPGMSLRDYFAAHAPKKPQPWFQPVFPSRPDAIYHEGHNESCYDCSPENWRELQAWNSDRNAQALLQWPYAWADAMLRERQK